ncbi:hypothetical protein JTE90_021339 [Oedothorax gibbosus]|uniref:Uncharacterized protein n=1 Tax=Oedothorax gibbosus TaxID=931172 RepID=A0AAV6TY11_9ARAC|nr:hypothetical protein JTE90_021339 [Oedothorax gibbosus]
MSISRPKTLERAVHDTLQVYGAAAILAVLIIIFIPSWLRWCAFYLFGTVFLTSVLAPFVEIWKPRSRVQASGKAVFISGCDTGFGHLLARRLDDLGLQVFAGCLLPDGDGAKALKKTASNRLHLVHLDVTQEDSIDKALQYVTTKLKDNKLWAVINNAGISDGGELIWTNTDIIQKVIDVNMYGVVKVTKAFLPLLCKYKGRVITVCSAAGRYSYPGMVPYCMSKHAAVSFCEGLRLEMYRFGVKVITIEPWMYKTPITSENPILKFISKTWEQAPSEVRDLHPADYLQRYKKCALKFLNYAISDKPQQVVDCMEEAVMALHPQYSYNPGTVYSKTSHWFIQRLPKPVADAAIHEEFVVNI